MITEAAQKAIIDITRGRLHHLITEVYVLNKIVLHFS